MKITFLGTGAGRPSKLRNTSSAFIEFNRLNVLIDVGEATQHQLLQTSIRPNRIDVICITHNHGDHIYGIPGLLNTMAIEGRTEPVLIVCNEDLKNLIKLTLKVTKSHLGFKLYFTSNDDGLLHLPLSEEIVVSTFPLSHDDINCTAYRFDLSKENISNTKMKKLGIQPGPILGELKRNGSIEYEGKTITLSDVSDQTKEHYVFCGDNDIKKVVKKKNPQKSIFDTFITFVENAKVLVHEATLLEQNSNYIEGHSFLDDVLTFAKENKIEKLILNHISSRYFINECEDILKNSKKNTNFNKVILSKDLLEVSV